MATYKCKTVNGCVWGRMPSGVAMRFKTEDEYAKAYHAEEDEIADELARLDAERQAYNNMVDFDEWLRYA